MTATVVEAGSRRHMESRTDVVAPRRALQRIECRYRLGVTASGLDLTSHSATLDNGENVGYDGLIIAAGVEPRRLTEGHDLSGVYALRTMGGALALLADLQTGTRLAVVGAGGSVNSIWFWPTFRDGFWVCQWLRSIRLRRRSNPARIEPRGVVGFEVESSVPTRHG
ncbi:FAD-dependent oxidoreductase [Rhodococcus sp. NPDC059968]|uniref:FAD-dependent oxidoreductase n=1 Tax=Rhodococcus sp. NPDC059968 TaxID=3347017 RepID=UPI00366E6CF6